MIYKNLKNKAVDFLNKNFRKTKFHFHKKAIIISAFMIIFVLLPIFPFSVLTLAYEVKYDDVSIGYVSKPAVFEKAETIANRKIIGNISKSTEYNIALVPNDSLETASMLSKKLLISNNLTATYGIYADDSCIVAGKTKTTLINAIEIYKNKALKNTDFDSTTFDKKIEIKKCLSTDNYLSNLEESIAALEKNVKVYTVKYTEDKIKTDYKTIYKDDKNLYKGLTKVKTDGKNGEKSIKKINVYYNGKKISSETIEKKTISKPTNEIILKGTKKLPDIKPKKGCKYIWPLQKGVSYNITSKFGIRHGRLHKGIDIVTNYGTNILAADSGKVTRASWFESYGNCVDILHSDGTLTRYAHCSSISVKVGDSVVAGQVIAKVGSTGRSTANHLHFEVRPNAGDPVNPINFVK